MTSPPILLEILGRFQLTVAGSPARLRTRRTENLFAFLALRESWHSRDALADIFWENDEPSVARQKLRLALSSIRSAVGEALETRGTEVRLVHVAVDARLALADVDSYPAIEPILPGCDDLWLHEFRHEYETELANELRNRAANYEGNGEYSPATVLRYRLADLEPLDIRNQVKLLRSLQRLGRCQEIRRFLDKLGAIPPELAEFHDSPSLSETPRVDCNSFIAREAELELLMEKLLGDDEPAWVTLVGPPGVGKTRLSKELLRRAPAYDVDATFCALADLKTIAEVVREINRSVFGDEDSVSTPELANRIATCAPRLLVLDNAEHLDAAELEVNLLQLLLPGSSIRVLITSQALIGSEAEVLIRLQPLSDQATSGVLSPRVRLFITRAQEYLPASGPSAQELEEIKAICNLLEGLPLAIEVAAATLAVQPLSGLAKTLELSAKKRSMESAVAWSLSLLEPETRQLFDLVAAFEGSIYPDRASAVLGRDVSKEIETLVNRSLLNRDVGSSSLRFTLLESVRLAAKSRPSRALLVQINKVLAEDLIRMGTDQSPDLRLSLVPDLRSIDRLLAGLVRSCEWGSLAEMASGIAQLSCSTRGALWANEELLLAFQGLPAEDKVRRAKVANALANLAYFRGDRGQAALWWKQRAELLDPAANPAVWASAITNLGLAELESGKSEIAAARFAEAIPLFEKHGVTRQVVTALLNLSGAQLALRQYDVAQISADRALQLATSDESLADWVGLASLRLAELHYVDGQDAEALLWTLRSAEVFEGIEQPLRLADALHRATFSALRSGNAESAEQSIAKLSKLVMARPYGAILRYACRAVAANAGFHGNVDRCLRLLGFEHKLAASSFMFEYPAISHRDSEALNEWVDGPPDHRAEFRIGQTLTLKEALKLLY